MIFALVLLIDFVSISAENALTDMHQKAQNRFCFFKRFW